MVELSVIIPAYNRRDCLERSMLSVFAQDADISMELIVVDDGSTDDTISLIKRYQSLQEIPISYIRNEINQGGAKARNQGALISNGKYIAFLDSDDEWLPNHIRLKLNQMINVSAKGVYGTFFVEKSCERTLKSFKALDEKLNSMGDYVLQRIGDTRTSTFIFERQAFMDVMFDNSLRKHQDWDLAIRFSHRYPFILEETPTAILHEDTHNRMSNQNDHEATAKFIDRYQHTLSSNAKATAYVNLALNTLRFEGKNLYYRNYLASARQYVDAKKFKLLARMIYVAFPIINSVQFYDRFVRLRRRYRSSFFLSKTLIIFWIERKFKQMKQKYQKYFTDDYAVTKKEFAKKKGRELAVENPESFSDKLQWLKLYWRDDLATKCADKLLVREYVTEKGYEDILNEVYGVFEDVNQIEISKLPQRFVLKTTHGSGWNSFCKDRCQYDWIREKEKLKTWMKLNYFWVTREWIYKEIKPRIICEKYLGRTNRLPVDYKIFCFHGEPKFTYVCLDRDDDLRFDYYDIDWHKQPIKKALDMSDKILPRPENYDLMLDIAHKLSEPFPFVRVDLYEIEGKIFFGELTFFPSSGMDRFDPEVYDYIVGEMLDISSIMNRKKVLFVAKSDEHIRHFHLPYIQWFSKQGCKVEIASAGQETFTDAEVKSNIPVHSLPWKWTNFRAYRRLKHLVNQRHYDLIHCHTPVGGLLARIAAVKARKEGTKLIYTAHGFHFYKGAPFINWLFYYPIERILARWTDILITINAEDYHFALKKKLSAGEVYLVNGVGISREKFHPHTKLTKDELRKRYGYLSSSFILIYVAELKYRKHQDLIIRTVAKLKENISELKLLLVGDGEQYEEYAQLVSKLGLSEVISFLGYRHDVAELMQLSDIAVSSSKQEGLPVNVMEAMASGLPLVVTNCRGNRDLVSDGENGFIVPLDDERAFAEKIMLLYQEQALREKMGRNGLERVEPFMIENVLEEMEKIYKTVI